MPAWRWATQGLFDQLIKNYRNVTYNAQFSSLPILFGFRDATTGMRLQASPILAFRFRVSKIEWSFTAALANFRATSGCSNLLFGTESFGERTAVLSTAPVMRDGESSRTILVVNGFFTNLCTFFGERGFRGDFSRALTKHFVERSHLRGASVQEGKGVFSLRLRQAAAIGKRPGAVVNDLRAGGRPATGAFQRVDCGARSTSLLRS